MELHQALKLLNLKENYTEEELKESYRKLIIKYHPDKYRKELKPQMEILTKELNEAREILKRALSNKETVKNNNNTSQTSKNNKEYTNYKEENIQFKQYDNYIREFLSKEIDSIKEISNQDRIFNFYKIELLEAIFKYTNIAKTYTDTYTLKSSFENFLVKYNSILNDYYFSLTLSAHFNIDITKNYNYTTLKEFRQKARTDIYQILLKEFKKFENIPNIDKLQEQINIIYKYSINYCLYGIKDIKRTIEYFNNQITNEIKDFEERETIITTLTETKLSTEDYPIYINLINHINNKEKFWNIYSLISQKAKFKCKIRKLLK